MVNEHQKEFAKALWNLLEAYTGLNISIVYEDQKEWELGAHAEFEKQLKEAVEEMLNTEEYTTDEIAKVITNLTEILEEIDPEVFMK